MCRGPWDVRGACHWPGDVPAAHEVLDARRATRGAGGGRGGAGRRREQTRGWEASRARIVGPVAAMGVHAR